MPEYDFQIKSSIADSMSDKASTQRLTVQGLGRSESLPNKRRIPLPILPTLFGSSESPWSAAVVVRALLGHYPKSHRRALRLGVSCAVDLVA